MIKYVSLLLLFSTAFAAIPADLSLHKEVSRLEFFRKREGFTPEQRYRLAEIYFLTSRCGDVLELLADAPNPKIACACSGYCPPEEPRAKLDKLKEQLLMGFEDPKTQELWKEIKDNPEAQYVFIKSQAKVKNAKVREIVRQLEKNLESFEVK